MIQLKFIYYANEENQGNATRKKKGIIHFSAYKGEKQVTVNFREISSALYNEHGHTAQFISNSYPTDINARAVFQQTQAPIYKITEPQKGTEFHASCYIPK